jgi:S-DNA-T family DNA segregation ATPase FtsK/SpoIIIE
MGYKGLSILQSNLPHTIMICTSRKTPKIISLRECFEHPTFIDYEGTLKMVIGFDMDNNLVILDLLKEYHILICGETGSGKSVFLGNVLLSLLIHNSAEDLRFYLVDPKMVELNIYKEFPHVDEFISDMEDAKKLLYRLCREMDRRYEVLKKHDKRHISQIQPMYPGEYPYLICVIDELADLLMQEPNAEGYIIRLSQKARACGIHLILCTQKPSKEVLSSSIKSNMPTRLGFRCNASSDYVTIFGHTIPFEQLLGGGDGVMKSRNKQEMVRFQSPKVRPILEAEDEEDIVIDIGRAMSAQMQKGRFKLLSIEELKEKEADEETEKDPTLH